MDNVNRLVLLQEIYRIYQDSITELDWCCRPGCAACCTRNVTATTLEAALMVRALADSAEKAWIGRVRTASQEPRFQPLMTTNELADLCARDAEIPDEQIVVDTQPCPLLENGLCTVYAVRPFACRAMVSEADCAQSGEALMPPLVLSVNNLFMQFIEAVDVGRFFGNLIDLLDLMANPLEYHAYTRGLPMRVPTALRANRPLAVLMIPPEDRRRLEPIIDALRSAVRALA